MAKTIYFKSTTFISSKNRILIGIVLFSLLFLQGNNDNQHKAIRLIFTGDILLSRNVGVEIENRKMSPWIKLDTLLKSADFVLGNLEGSVGEYNHDKLADNESPVFDIPQSYLQLLKQAGFSAIGNENNHSLDLGDSGKANTINEILKVKLSPVSYDISPQFFNVKGIIIAIIAINLVPNHDKSCQEIPSIEIRQKLRLAKSLANLTVVYIHWGSELLDWPNNYQRNSAKWLIDNGADLIIGNHPHVIQKPEMIEGKPVFFSLGNHLFDQKYPDTKEGLIVDCRIIDGKLTCRGILTHTSKNSFFPEVTGKEQYNFEDIQLHNPLKISNITIKPLSIVDSKQSKIILECFDNDKKLWQTHPMQLQTIATSKLDGKNDFIITLEKHFSKMDNENNLRPYVYSIDKDGITAKWRGSALAWPLLDAIILPEDNQILCALHRGDSFINLKPDTKETRIIAYKWNGFGFSGLNDSIIIKQCVRSLKY
jgi:hypothetical protein